MRRHVVSAVFSLVFLWVIVITLLIARSPDPGSASPNGLASAYAQALRTNDTKKLGRLGPNGAPTAPAGCDHPSVAPVDRDGGTWLEVRDAAGRVCGRLPTSKQAGRWVIDPTAQPFH